MKKILLFTVVMVFVTTFFAGCSGLQQDNTVSTNQEVQYINEEYGFSIVLPASAQGFQTKVDKNPIPPGAVQTIEFSLKKGDGGDDFYRHDFLEVGVFTLEEWNKHPLEHSKMGSTPEYVFAAWGVTEGVSLDANGQVLNDYRGYELSEDELDKVRKSFRLLLQ